MSQPNPAQPEAKQSTQTSPSESSSKSETIVKPLDEKTFNPLNLLKRKFTNLPKWLKIILILLGSLLLLKTIIAIILGIFTAIVILPPTQQLQQNLTQIQQQATNLKNAVKDQNLTQVDQEITNLKTSLNSLDQNLNQFSWLQKVPQTNAYYQDAKHITKGAQSLLEAGQIGVTAIVPYADLLGFTVDPNQLSITDGTLDSLSENLDGTSNILKTNQTPPDLDEMQKAIDNTHRPGPTLAPGDSPVTPAPVPPTNVQKSEDQPITTEDRLQFVVKTLDTLVPQLDTITAQIDLAQQEFNQIDPQRYPESLDLTRIPLITKFINQSQLDQLKNTNPRAQLTQLLDLTNQAKVLLSDARPVLEVAPYILGNDEQRTYLVLFQNDAELRPTGGFLTAYALMTVDQGQIKPGVSRDIYELDARYHPDKAPEPILKYLPKVSQWNLRDMNLSPDFKVSMEQFYPEYQKTGSPQVDGIIAVDTQFLLKLLEVTGPIGVGGIGNFSAEIVPECNCPQVVYELESAISFETPYIRENRKAIIGPLMHSVLANSMGQPKDKISQLVQAGLDSIQQKHILLYFPDEQVQTAIEAFNMAGRITSAENDYLMIVDTNFAGAKSNLYIEQQVDLKVQPGTDSSVHELTVTYKNPQKHDEWLNGDFRNWVRIFVPPGSKLLEDSGSEIAMVTSEDLGKTVFEGFLVTRPEGLSKLTLKYETPAKNINGNFPLLIQKQGGTKNFEYQITVGDQTQNFELDEDKELNFNL
jgi:hypothetical protein